MYLLATAAGGFIGSVARYYCSFLFKRSGWSTWIVNVLGSIFLGFTISMYADDQLSPALFSFVGVGFCGAFTTFSTFGYECTQFMLDKRYTKAFLYAISMVLLSLVSVYVIVTLT